MSHIAPVGVTTEATVPIVTVAAIACKLRNRSSRMRLFVIVGPGSAIRMGSAANVNSLLVVRI